MMSKPNSSKPSRFSSLKKVSDFNQSHISKVSVPKENKRAKRSKPGSRCFTCRKIRKKCDLQKPDCRTCLHRGLNCRYPDNPSDQPQVSLPSSTSTLATISEPTDQLEVSSPNSTINLATVSEAVDQLRASSPTVTFTTVPEGSKTLKLISAGPTTPYHDIESHDLARKASYPPIAISTVGDSNYGESVCEKKDSISPSSDISQKVHWQPGESNNTYDHQIDKNYQFNTLLHACCQNEMVIDSFRAYTSNEDERRHYYDSAKAKLDEKLLTEVDHLLLPKDTESFLHILTTLIFLYHCEWAFKHLGPPSCHFETANLIIYRLIPLCYAARLNDHFAILLQWHMQSLAEYCLTNKLYPPSLFSEGTFGVVCRYIELHFVCNSKGRSDITSTPNVLRN